jgi:hypothetical protein
MRFCDHVERAEYVLNNAAEENETHSSLSIHFSRKSYEF